ncbi:MAG: SDR family NAD(P)-dependent oxidoreductase, partial [Myxococcota bacterium]
IDVLVNNASATSSFGETPSTTDMNTATRALDVTLLGAWRVIQAFLQHLRRSAHGRVVNVSSGAGSHGDPTFGLTTDNAMGPTYAVAKAALNALTVCWANELEGDGVLVNAVGPGFTATFEGGEGMGARPVAEGAASVVWGCLLPDDGPTGGFFRDGQPVPW